MFFHPTLHSFWCDDSISSHCQYPRNTLAIVNGLSHRSGITTLDHDQLSLLQNSKYGVLQVDKPNEETTPVMLFAGYKST